MRYSCNIGTPALTSRNFKEADFEKVIEYLDRGVQLTFEAKQKTGLHVTYIFMDTSIYMILIINFIKVSYLN